MEPQIFAAIGAAVAVGIAGSKLIDHFWPNSKNGSGEWRSKIETLIEQQLKYMEKAQEQSAEQTRVMGLIEHRMGEHEKRESQAWRDIFELLRDLKT